MKAELEAIKTKMGEAQQTIAKQTLELGALYQQNSSLATDSDQTKKLNQQLTAQNAALRNKGDSPETTEKLAKTEAGRKAAEEALAEAKREAAKQTEALRIAQEALEQVKKEREVESAKTAAAQERARLLELKKEDLEGTVRNKDETIANLQWVINNKNGGKDSASEAKIKDLENRVARAEKET